MTLGSDPQVHEMSLRWCAGALGAFRLFCSAKDLYMADEKRYSIRGRAADSTAYILIPNLHQSPPSSSRGILGDRMRYSRASRLLLLSVVKISCVDIPIRHAPRKPCATHKLCVTCDGHLPGAHSGGFPLDRSVDRAAFTYRHSLRKIVYAVTHRWQPTIRAVHLSVSKMY